MTDPNIWFGIAGLLALVIFAAGSWLLHRRLRNRHSFRFLLAVIALVLWVPASSLVTAVLIAHPEPGSPSQIVNLAAVASEIIAPALILLLAATSFFFAVRSIAPQPNNSSKPTPLRGAA